MSEEEKPTTDSERTGSEKPRYQVELPEDLKKELFSQEEEGGPSSEASDSAPTEEKELASSPQAWQEEKEALERERDEWREKYLRALADLDNARKRFQREAMELRKYAVEVALKEILPVLDNLERALKSATNPDHFAQLREGLELVVQQFHQVLAQLGVKPVEGEGAPFNPEVHEAIGEVEREDMEPQRVAQEVVRGYWLHDRLLRPAKVLVSRAPEGLPRSSGPEGEKKAEEEVSPAAAADPGEEGESLPE